MSIEVEDVLGKRREAERLVEELTEILTEANANLVKTYGHLAQMVEDAAASDDLENVKEGLDLIDRLNALGFSGRSLAE